MMTLPRTSNIFKCARFGVYGPILAAAVIVSPHTQDVACARKQAEEYSVEAPKTILELQQFRRTSSAPVKSPKGIWGTATLTDLSPSINVWYLLKIRWNGSGVEAAYHLENPEPQTRKIILGEKYPAGLVVIDGNNRQTCTLFGADGLEQARASRRVFAPLCGGRLYLRNAATGHQTALESLTELLREHVWGGEKIIDLGHILMGDTHRETGAPANKPLNESGREEQGELPLPALVNASNKNASLSAGDLGIRLALSPGSDLGAGKWYAAAGNPGIYASILQPDLIEPSILEDYKTRVDNLDGVEATSLCYLLAFDLDQYDVGYALGTIHPKLNWSDRVLPQVKNAKLPGPDGIGDTQPLVSVGLVGPENAARTAATFTGGFKRTHGAFRYGELAVKSHGSHYGFIENGVVFSKLQPGLATFYVLADGSAGMKTWTENDNKLLMQIRFARQNGVALAERDPATQRSIPGPLVRQWGPGNWSGSQEGKLRTLRSGLALQTQAKKKFLIYAVFSDATPSAMARIFQSYSCDYAMLLDMNALEHTYAAVYRREKTQLFVDHLVKGMAALDQSAGTDVVPRFLGYPDNRDFFYVMRRDRKQSNQ